MAALTITAANVGVASDAVDVRTVQVGEAVTQGMPGRISSNKYYQCNNSTAADAAASVIFLTAANTDGYALALFSGTYIVGATVAVGTTYCVGDADGEIFPITDLGSGDYSTILGTAVTTTTIAFDPKASGVAVP